MRRFPGWAAALGPGIVWMALAQGSGELIWWPYIVAKYGLGLLFFLVPACLIQWPVTYAIGRYTMLTGETIWQGFIRQNRFFAFGLWILMTVQFLWFGAFASAGGTALAALTGVPAGWSEGGRSLFWGYVTIAVFFAALVLARRVYGLVEKFMWAVAIVTLVGLAYTCMDSRVLTQLPAFTKGLFVPAWPEGRVWDPNDTTRLLTAVTFAGLGGFWTLFYSYWIREKSVGMAGDVGHMTGALGVPEKIPDSGFLPDESQDTAREVHRWRRFLVVDSGIGVFGNLATTFMTGLLAYVFLFPTGTAPDGWQITVVQSRFFEASLGDFGRTLFLLVAAAFMADTWLSTTDAVARVHSDIAHAYFPAARKRSPRFWYYAFVTGLTVLTAATMPLAQPGPLILISAVIGFLGTVLYTYALLFLSYKRLAAETPYAKSRLGFFLLLVPTLCYTGLFVAYLAAELGAF